MADEIKLTKLAKCAGCGAKVGAGVLAQLLEDIKVHTDPNLLVGFDKSDDASVYKLSHDLALVQTVDFFPPIADDPYVFGQIAATNALSDVYAMGGEPKLCLNIMAVPKDMPKEAVHQLLRGGYDKVYEAGVDFEPTDELVTLKTLERYSLHDGYRLWRVEAAYSTNMKPCFYYVVAVNPAAAVNKFLTVTPWLSKIKSVKPMNKEEAEQILSNPARYLLW